MGCERGRECGLREGEREWDVGKGERVGCEGDREWGVRGRGKGGRESGL